MGFDHESHMRSRDFMVTLKEYPGGEKALSLLLPKASAASLPTLNPHTDDMP